MVPGGLFSLVAKKVENLDRYLIMASGFIVVLTLIQHPNGVADSARPLRSEDPQRVAGPRRRVRSARRGRPRTTSPTAEPPADLIVEGLTVTFGAVRAVDGVDLVVRPGRIVGLIGPTAPARRR